MNRIISTLTVIFSFIFCGGAKGQNLINWEWQNNYNIDFRDIEYKNNHLYAVGNFTVPSVTIGGNTYNNAGSSDIIICKLDTIGNVIWSKHFGSVNNENLENLCIDSNGAVCVIGSMEGSLNIGSINLNSNGNKDILVIKLSNNGVVEWADNIGNTYNNVGVDITSDYLNNIVIAGNSAGVVSFGGVSSPANAFSLFCKYSSSGNELMLNWLYPYNGPGNPPANGVVKSIKYSAIDSSIVYGGGLYCPGAIQYNNGYIYQSYAYGIGSGTDLIIGKIDKNGLSIFINNISQSYNKQHLLSDISVMPNGNVMYNSRYQSSLSGYAYNNWETVDIYGNITSLGFSLNSNASLNGFCVAPHGGRPNKMQLVDSILYATLYQKNLVCGSNNCTDYYGIKYNYLSNQMEYYALDPDKSYYGGTGFNGNLFLISNKSIGKNCINNCITPTTFSLHNAPDVSLCSSNNVKIGLPECYYIIGGTLPYTYNWQPATGLNATNIAQPTVSSANISSNMT